MKLWEPFTFFSFQKVLVQKQDYRYLPKKKLILQSFLWCAKQSQESWLGVSKLCPAFGWMQHRDAELTIALNLNLEPRFTGQSLQKCLQLCKWAALELEKQGILLCKCINCGKPAANFIYWHFRKFSPLYLYFLFLRILCSQLNIVVQVNQWSGCGVIIVSTMGLQLLRILLL